MKMRPEALLFDMDGLMFDTERQSDVLWQSESAKMGWPLTQQDVALLRGKNREAGKAAFVARFGKEFPYDEMFDTVHAAHTALLAKEVPLRPGLRVLLAQAHALGLPMAVASSTCRKQVLANLVCARVQTYFSAVVCGDEVAHSKPAPDIYEAAAAQLGVPCANCLVLEDSYNGVRSGAAAGCRVVMVPDLDPVTPEMERLASAIVPDLAAVVPLLAKA